jgi:hypothetical protein
VAENRENNGGIESENVESKHHRRRRRMKGERAAWLASIGDKAGGRKRRGWA